jgi:hypothetical protein
MDRRHQRDGRSDWNRGFQSLGERISGKWLFFKMNLETGKTENLKEGKALLEISTVNFKQRIVESVRTSPRRKMYFSNSYLSTDTRRDVDWFDSIAEMKRGGKIFTPTAVYWAKHQKPQKSSV